MTFDIALTGLNAASADLEVVSNNIANNATTGFKRSRAEFADVYATSALGVASNAIGEGVRVANIRQEFTQGDVTFTDNNLDLSISGEGFFRMDDNGSTVYSRAGTFGLDREGNIINAYGQTLTGYTADSTGAITPVINNLRIDPSDLSPQATTSVELSMNLDNTATVPGAFDVNDSSTYNFTTSTTIYDSLGTAHVASMYFHKDAANDWTSYLYVGGNEVSQPGGDNITFNPDGSLDLVNGGTGTTITTTAFTPAVGVTPMTVTFDVGAISQFNNPFGVNQIVQDGYSSGRLNDVDIDATGVIYGRYSNGQSKALGQIVLTNFPNPQGLRQVGNTSWAETYGSGVAATGVPGSASLGMVQSGSLEESNVDITAELVAMISAQRSFQANAQVISTADTLTQTVINMRR